VPARGPGHDEIAAIAAADFTWEDGERTVRFGRGAIKDAPSLLGDGYTLLTTPRARAAAPSITAHATAIHEVPAGRVDELAGELLGEVEVDGEATLLVALGGGRVIDTAKALAAARDPATGERPRVAAIPTTLSAAEMTRVHRRAAGADTSLPSVRPQIVLNDPALTASQPALALAASAANALGHAIEGPATIRASPVPALAGAEAARLITGAYAGGGHPDRDDLALAALLSGYTIDACGYGLHHVLSQTLARVAGVSHAQANAAMLPHTIAALRSRGAPDAGGFLALARELARRAGAEHLRTLGVSDADLDACADTAAGRPDLDMTPPRAGRDELRAIYASAA
jgi:alcohol dehydrogenase class IV